MPQGANKLAYLPIVASLFAYAVASAQATTPEQAIAAADRTLACVREPHDDITQWLRLLAEAKATLQSRTASEAARRDARESIGVLGSRLRESAAALAACAEPRNEGTHPVADAPPTTPALEPISVHVHSHVPRVVDGRGHVDNVDVHEGLLRLGSAFDACYEALTERRALESGDAHFVFGLAGREVRNPTVEGLVIGDATFSQCIARTVRGFRVTRGATGGDARVDVVLHFGPE